MDAINRSNLKMSLRVIFAGGKRTIRILAARPSLILAGARLHLHQKKAAKVRQKAREGGLDVPVMMLVSITSRCNLSCRGCYMLQRKPRPEPEMTLDELRSVISQAEDIGVSVISLVGGEPLVRRNEVLNLARSFPRILFTLNTNGILIDEDMAAELAGCVNLVPFISLEGFQIETDSRRGQGVYDRVLAACSLLSTRLLFFGCAVTVSRNTISEVLDESFIRTMIGAGVRAFIFIQYVPAEPGTEDLVPTPEQRRLLIASMDEFNRKYPAFFIGIPGDMEMFDGCLAAGRGFIHVNPYGDLEPCPVVPLSDVNLRTVPLREALQSRLLRAIRSNHSSLKANGRCVLRTDPLWPEKTASKK
jgi:MoaA/NifB/PqqE/SkfB family radical SAM enzyme